MIWIDILITRAVGMRFIAEADTNTTIFRFRVYYWNFFKVLTIEQQWNDLPFFNIKRSSDGRRRKIFVTTEGNGL